MKTKEIKQSVDPSQQGRNSHAMEKRRAIAKNLFQTGKITQKEIAELVGVSERTMSKWVAEGNWDKNLSETIQSVITGIQQELLSYMDIAKKEPDKVLPAKYADARIKTIRSLQLLQENQLNDMQRVSFMTELLEFVTQKMKGEFEMKETCENMSIQDIAHLILNSYINDHTK